MIILSSSASFINLHIHLSKLSFFYEKLYHGINVNKCNFYQVSGKSVEFFEVPGIRKIVDELEKLYWKVNFCLYLCLRPYHVENTSSRPITEVKQHWAELVLGWVTAWEYSVL